MVVVVVVVVTVAVSGIGGCACIAAASSPAFCNGRSPDSRWVRSEVYVRISELPVQESIRDIRQCHMNCLIRVDGVVTRRTSVFPKLYGVKYSCGVCGYLTGAAPPQHELYSNKMALITSDCGKMRSLGIKRP